MLEGPYGRCHQLAPAMTLDLPMHYAEQKLSSIAVADTAGQREQRPRRSKGRRGQGQQQAAEQVQGRSETRPEEILASAQHETAELPAGTHGLTLPDSVRNQPPGRRRGRGDGGSGIPASSHPPPASAAGSGMSGADSAHGRPDHRRLGPAISHGVHEDMMRPCAADDRQDYSSRWNAEAGPAPPSDRQPPRARQAALSREQLAPAGSRRINPGVADSQGRDVGPPSDQQEGTSGPSGMRGGTQQPAAAAAAAADWCGASRDDGSEPGPSRGRRQPRARQGGPPLEQSQRAAGQDWSSPFTPQSQHMPSEGSWHVSSAGSGARPVDEQAADASRGSRGPPQGIPDVRNTGAAGRHGPEQAADPRRGGRGRGRGRSPLGAGSLQPAGAGRQGRGSGSTGRRGRNLQGFQGDFRETERFLPNPEGPRQVRCWQVVLGCALPLLRLIQQTLAVAPPASPTHVS